MFIDQMGMFITVVVVGVGPLIVSLLLFSGFNAIMIELLNKTVRFESVDYDSGGFVLGSILGLEVCLIGILMGLHQSRQNRRKFNPEWERFIRRINELHARWLISGPFKSK
jgi:hypothetical protein